MTSYKIVSVPSAAFAFCRYSLALFVWISFFRHSKVVLSVVCVLFLLSAILKVKNAPLVWLYSATFNKIKPSEEVMLNQHAIYFAHVLGLILSVLCLLAVCLINANWAWYFVLAFAILKTISAVGFCPAEKLYNCITNGTCCVIKKKTNGNDPSHQ